MKSLALVSTLVSFFGFATVLTLSQPALAQVSPITKEVGKARLALAGSLIKALDANEVCETDAYPSGINELVSSATMQLEKTEINAWVSKLPSDSIVRSDLAFRQAVNPVQLADSTVSKVAVEAQLVGTKFYKFGVGVYGSPQNITLGQGGVALVRNLNILEDAPYWEWAETSAPWSVSVVKTTWGERAVLKVGNKEFDFEQQSGEIWLKPTNVPEDDVQSETLSTSDSYCEA